MTCCRQSAETHARSDKESDPARADSTGRAGPGVEPGYDKTVAYKRIERDVENMLLSQRNLPL